MMKLYATIPQKEVIYKGKIKRTGTGQGYVYMKDEYLGCRAYIIFPQKYEFDGANYLITIDEVLNLFFMYHYDGIKHGEINGARYLIVKRK